MFSSVLNLERSSTRNYKLQRADLYSGVGFDSLMLKPNPLNIKYALVSVQATNPFNFSFEELEALQTPLSHNGYLYRRRHPLDCTLAL